MSAKDDRMRLEYMELGELLKYPDNPKKHDEAFLEASFREYGYVQPILIDEGTGILASGHGRLERLEAERAAGDPPPERIRVKAGKWYVPVIRGVRFKNKAQLGRYLLADNRGVELGGWDNKLLAKMLSTYDEADLFKTGFTKEDFAAFMVEAGGAAPGTGAENVYTKKIQAPVYEPKGEKPAVGELCDLTKTNALLDEIGKAKLPEEVKAFLRLAAYRHAVFNYEKVAEFYAHCSPDEQDLFENSALVIIDFGKAIEKGFVVMTEEIAELYPRNADDADEA